MGLGAESVDLVGGNGVDDASQPGAVGKIAVMKEQPWPGVVGVEIEPVDAVGVEGAGAADDAVDLEALLQQEFRQIGAVLAGDAGDQGFLHALAFMS